MQTVCCKRRKPFANEVGCSSLHSRGGRLPRTRTASSAPGTCQGAFTTEDRARTRCSENSSSRYVSTIRRSSAGSNAPANQDLSSFVATNKEILKYAREDPQMMYNLLVQLRWEKRPLNAVNVATIFHASAKTPDILTPDVMDYLTDSLQRVDGFDARAIGNACYGLQGLKDSPLVHRVLDAMASKVKDCLTDFNAQQVGNALYGLQNLRDSQSARRLVHALQPKVVACREPFSSQAIASACWGLRHLGDSREVRGMFGILASKVEQLSEMSETQDAFSSMPTSDRKNVSKSLQTALRPHIPTPKFQLDGQGISNILNALQCMENYPEVLRLILAVSVHAEKVTKLMKPQELSSSFYGLRCIRGSPFEVRRLLAALRWQLKSCQEYFMCRHIATILYGLRWLGDSDEARSVLLVCAEKTRGSSEAFDGHAIGNCLYGLQSFPCCDEVQEVLDALAPRIEACQKSLSGQEIGNAFYGFRSVGDCDEVRRMLGILTEKLKQCGHLDPQAISNALYGLHAFGNIPNITRPLFDQLCSRIHECRESFRLQAISNSFFGLQSMEDSPLSRRLLAALTNKLEECRENLTPTHFGNMLYNVRSFGDVEEIRMLLRILKFRFKDCIGSFQDNDIAHAFLGLSSLGGYAEVRDILQLLTPHVESCGALNAQDISICLNALKALHRVDEIRPLLKVMASKLKVCGDKMLDHHLRKALGGVRQFGDVEEVRHIYCCLVEKAHRDGVSLAGTFLQKFDRLCSKRSP